MEKLSFFIKNEKKVQSAAIFLSGTGTNAEAILKYLAENSVEELAISVLITDRPEASRAKEIAQNFDIPVLEHSVTVLEHSANCAFSSAENKS